MDEEKFKEVVTKVDHLLKEDVDELDKIIEELAGEEHQVPAGVAKFAELVIEKLFEEDAEEVLEDYKEISKTLTLSTSEEDELRNYYIKVIESRRGFNPEKGEITDPDEFSDALISATNKWLEKIKEREDPYGLEGEKAFMRFGSFNSEEQFIRALLLFALVVLISGVALRMRLDKIKGGKKVREIISSAYKHTLSERQYETLKEENLLGGILFRGKQYDSIKKGLEVINEDEVPRGTHWSTEWDVAVRFAGNVDVDSIVGTADSLEEFKSILKKISGERKAAILIDKKETLKKVLKFLDESLDEEGKNRMRWGFIFSCFPSKKGLHYLGKKAPEYFKSTVPSEEEIWTLPEDVEIEDHTIDGLIQFSYFKLDYIK